MLVAVPVRFEIGRPETIENQELGARDTVAFTAIVPNPALETFKNLVAEVVTLPKSIVEPTGGLDQKKVEEVHTSVKVAIGLMGSFDTMVNVSTNCMPVDPIGGWHLMLKFLDFPGSTLSGLPPIWNHPV